MVSPFIVSLSSRKDLVTRSVGSRSTCNTCLACSACKLVGNVTSISQTWGSCFFVLSAIDYFCILFFPETSPCCRWVCCEHRSLFYAKRINYNSSDAMRRQSATKSREGGPLRTSRLLCLADWDSSPDSLETIICLGLSTIGLACQIYHIVIRQLFN